MVKPRKVTATVMGVVLAAGLCPVSALAAPSTDLQASGLQDAAVMQASAGSPTLKADRLYQANIKWNKEDGSEGSSMGRHMQSTAQVSMVDGEYRIILTPVASSDPMIADLTYDGKSLPVVSAEGATPRQFQLDVDAIADPIAMGITVNAGSYGMMNHGVQLVVDGESLEFADPVLDADTAYVVPMAIYKEGTYGTADEAASMAGGFFNKNTDVKQKADGTYSVKVTIGASDQVTFEKMTFGADDAEAPVVKNDDGSMTFDLTFGKLSDVMRVGFTYTPTAMGRSMTHYADMVLSTAQVAKPADVSEGQGDVNPSIPVLTQDKTYVADAKLLKSDSDEESMAGGYMADVVKVRKNADGTYAVTVSANEKGVPEEVKVYAADGTLGKDVTEQEGVLSYELTFDSISQPMPILFGSKTMDAMGRETQPARLVLDLQTLSELTVPMYRLYNPNSGEHFYTAIEDERAKVIAAGWDDEGVGWIAPAKGYGEPVFRLYNKYGGEHHYTTDASERDHLVSLGWDDEGVGWYSDPEQRVKVLREYNPNAFANNHNYTPDQSEHDNLVSLGWNDEGIGWYGAREAASE